MSVCKAGRTQRKCDCFPVIVPKAAAGERLKLRRGAGSEMSLPDPTAVTNPPPLGAEAAGKPLTR